MQDQVSRRSIYRTGIALIATFLCLPAFAIRSIAASPAAPTPAFASDQVDRYVYRYDLLTLDPALVARDARSTGVITIETGLETYRIALEPHDLRAPGYRAQETLPDGSTREVEMGEVTTYAGHLLDRDGQTARFTIDERGVRGMIVDHDDKLFLEPLESYSLAGGPTDYVFYRESDVRPLDEPGTCAVTAADKVADAAEFLSRDAATAAATSTTYVVQIATDADNEYASALGGSAAANSEILSILNQVDGVYRAELGLEFAVVLQNTYAGSDPYSGTTNPSDLLYEMRSVWNSSMSGVGRDVAHLFTGRDLDGSTIGIAFIDVVCNSPSYSYGLSQRYISSPQKYVLTAHEIGHNFSACHSDTSCNPNPSSCSNTIMQSAVGTGFTFCDFSRNQIASHLSVASSCLGTGTTSPPPTAPAAPSNASASAASSSQINLTWSDNSSDESGFKIERKTGASGSWSQIASTSANATSYASTGLSAATLYTYRVRAYNGSGESSNSNETSAQTPGATASAPARPTNASAAATSSSQINLTWSDNSSDETGFKIERMTGLVGTWTQVAATSANTRSYSDTGLSPSTLYQYRVRAYNGGGDSSYSNDTSAYTLAGSTPPPPPQSTPPATPSSLSATAMSTSQINLAWSDNSSDETGFKLERKTGASGSWSQVATAGANATSYADTGLAAGTTYYYRARATNATGDSSYTNETSATTNAASGTPPARPTNASASAVSAFQINLVWSDNSSDESGFKIERMIGLVGTWTQVATASANTRSYSDTGLLASTLYQYRVRAYNGGGDSIYSNDTSAYTLVGSTPPPPPAPTAPAAPSNASASAASTSQINLTWSDNSSDESGFKLERKTGASGSWSQIAAASASTTSYSDTGLASSTTYVYRVRAYNGAGDSSYTNETSATTQTVTGTPPARPTNASAAAASSSQINLVWSDNSSDESGFKIERITGLVGTWTQVATASANTRSYSDTGLSPSTLYQYRVRAYNGGGDSIYSNDTSAYTLFGSPTSTAPTAPTNASASAASSSQINLTWSDNSSDETGFKIERKTGVFGSWAQVAAASANTTGYSDTGLEPGTTYFYRVRAYNTAGDSSYTNETSATTPAASGPAPVRPTNASVSAFSSTQLNLVWSDNSSDESGFKIERMIGLTGPWVQIAATSANTRSYADTGLTPGTLYIYRVRATNGSNDSGYSNETSAYTLP